VNILKDVLSELFGMFVTDVRLTVAILATVSVAALLINATHLPPLTGGAILLLGCVTVLFFSVRREAVQRQASHDDLTS